MTTYIAAVVSARAVVAESVAGVGLSVAPTSLGGIINGAGVDGHVQRALILRDLTLGRDGREGESEGCKGGAHLERCVP